MPFRRLHLRDLKLLGAPAARADTGRRGRGRPWTDASNHHRRPIMKLRLRRMTAMAMMLASVPGAAAVEMVSSTILPTRAFVLPHFPCEEALRRCSKRVSPVECLGLDSESRLCMLLHFAAAAFRGDALASPNRGALQSEGRPQHSHQRTPRPTPLPLLMLLLAILPILVSLTRPSRLLPTVGPLSPTLHPFINSAFHQRSSLLRCPLAGAICMHALRLLRGGTLDMHARRGSAALRRSARPAARCRGRV